MDKDISQDLTLCRALAKFIEGDIFFWCVFVFSILEASKQSYSKNGSADMYNDISETVSNTWVWNGPFTHDRKHWIDKYKDTYIEKVLNFSTPSELGRVPLHLYIVKKIYNCACPFHCW